MHFYKKKSYKLSILLILSVFLFSISIYQTQYFHWSAILDQDIVLIYNSLLISSGVEQEYRDHPAYTTFLIHGLLLKFFSFINLGPISNINDLIASTDPNTELQKLFFFCRNVNVAINIFLVFFLYKLLIKLKCDELSAFLGCCILIVSGWFVESTFLIRSENLSIIFFLISSIYQIKFYEARRALFIIFSGFFFGVAMLTKIQIIFLFIFPIFINLIYLNQYIKKNLIKKFTNSYDFILFISYFLIIILYLILQLKLQTFERFEKIKYLDLILFSIFNIFFLFLILIINNFNFKKIKLFFVFMSLYFIGFGISVFFVLFFDFINLVELNHYILFRLTNPFHYMIEFHVGDFPGLYDNAKVNLDYFINLFLIAIKKYDYNFLKIFILFLITILSTRNTILSKSEDNSHIYIKNIAIFMSILSLIYILNLRGFIYYYETLVVIPYIIAISYLLKNFSKRLTVIVYSFLILYFAYCNFFLMEKRKDVFNFYFSSQSSLNLICDEDEIFYSDNSYRFFMEYYHHRFNDKFFNKLCLKSL